MAVATAPAGLTLAEPLRRTGAIPSRSRSSVRPETAERDATTLTALQFALAGLGLAMASYAAAESGSRAG